ncbi:hypothetical protein ACJX0J_011866, partial [Zea mays]
CVPTIFGYKPHFRYIDVYTFLMLASVDDLYGGILGTYETFSHLGDPDRITYTTLIKGLESLGKMELAETLLQQVLLFNRKNWRGTEEHGFGPVASHDTTFIMNHMLVYETIVYFILYFILLFRVQRNYLVFPPFFFIYRGLV